MLPVAGGQTLNENLLQKLDVLYGYLDLEVDPTGTIYCFGLVSPNASLEVDQAQANQIYDQLVILHRRSGGLCGHNIRRFDQLYLNQKWADLATLPIIDTLELSVLAFPLQPSHKLHKDYKPSQYASNHPLEDARATRLLLQHTIDALRCQPESLQQTYVWLLTCGDDEADQAYQQFFSILGPVISTPPGLDSLPIEALTGVDNAYLKQLWNPTTSKSVPFDQRLILAALLSWNYTHNQERSTQPVSTWLTHLPGFPTILDQLFPVVPEGFTYHPYLEAFHIPEFRGKQEDAVQAIVDGKCPLVLMATGGGKSLCYQLPALMFYQRQQGLTICISPLQALMEDQVRELENLGLDFATYINGMLSAPERAQRLDKVRQGRIGLLYISPEQLRSISIRALLMERLPVLWVVDEVHCVSQWGADFRPDYRYIPKFIQELYAERQVPLPRFALLTATATDKVRQDIRQLFTQYGLDVQHEIISTVQRDNLTYEVIVANGNKHQEICNAVKTALEQEGCALVYTTTRKESERLSMMLNQQGVEARHYHGKLPRQEKSEVLNAFKDRTLNVVTATCAFGMGINRPDVRAVIHHTMSSSLEAYIQESGRAGRDQHPAVCTLLFDEQDADTIFFLKSLNQLSETDLRNIFEAIRGLRNRIYKSSDRVSEDWFWVTPEEIFQTSELDDAFATEDEQRNTKIKVALHQLETFGMTERAENLSTFVQFSLNYDNPQQSCRQFGQYSRDHNVSNIQVEQFERLIYTMHLAKVHCQHQDDPFPLDRLSDESGIRIEELPNRIRELQRAGICAYKLPLTLLLTKGVTGDAQNKYERLRGQEERLLEILLDLQKDRDTFQVNLRGIATHLDPEGQQKIKASTLMHLLESWQSQGWVQLQQLTAGIFRLENLNVADSLSQHQNLISLVLEALYIKLGAETGSRLRVEYDLQQLLDAVNQRSQPHVHIEADIKAVLLWLHQHEVLRLTDGLNLFSQALKMRVIKGARIDTVRRRYRELKERYDEQARQTHLMVQYGKTLERDVRHQLVTDYFQLAPQEFDTAHPELASDAAKRPITQLDYNQIMKPLNPAQRAIVEADESAMVVIAGPGSGKTRTIVHRIAYLVKVKRVNPNRILVLAYNRNAVGELRLRLQSLIGALAFNLRVFTFHGLSLSLLGRTLGQNQTARKDQENSFQQLLKDACALLEQGDETDAEDDDSQMRRLQVLGNLEYIFVDEYQDVAEDEYRLIKLVAGLGQSEDEARSVQINLCAIGDDDQNIYEFRNTSTRYILDFEIEYRAKRLLLVENYRSTESIIAAANCLIQHNQTRCKRTVEEQVHINQERHGLGGSPVKALQFTSMSTQAAWVCEQIQAWIQAGIKVNQIAVLARQWEQLGPIRALLEQHTISTYALKGEDIRLLRNWSAHRLVEKLKEAGAGRVLEAHESVRDRFQKLFHHWGHSEHEPTIQTLLRIGREIDQERTGVFEEGMCPISADDILTTLFEFNESRTNFIQDDSVLVTSCHGAKGLEFQKVILLTDGFTTRSDLLEAERRLFYVAMTRAIDELILCSTKSCQFVQEAGSISHAIASSQYLSPQKISYLDLTPGDVYLGHRATQDNQTIIKGLREGEMLLLTVNNQNTGWTIQTQTGRTIGALSKAAVETLRKQRIQPEQFQFQPGEVAVRAIYQHEKFNEMTGELEESHFVVIPQIRICR